MLSAGTWTGLEEMAGSDSAPERFGIFISHRHQDHYIADILREQLVSISRGAVQLFFSPEIQGGAPYREWIRDSIARSDLLLLLLTDNAPLTQWCGYEVGRFLQRCEERGLSNRFVCLKNASVIAPPGPIEEFQAVDGETEPLYEFLLDLLEKGVYCGGRQIVKPFDDFYAQVRRGAARLAEAMSPALSTRRFHGRLVINFHDGHRLFDDPQIVSDLDFAEIAGRLGCPADAETLGAFRAAVAGTPAEVWLEELEAFVGGDAQGPGGPQLPVLSAFQDSNGVRYIPVIAEFCKINDQPKTVELLFVVMPDALRDIIELEKRDPLAMRQYEIIKLLRVGRRFRYDIIDPFLHAIEQAKIDQANAKFSEEKFRRTCQRFLVRLQRLVREGAENGYRTYSFTSDVLDLPSEDYMEKLYLDYSLIGLTDAIERLDLKEMRRALKTFRALNKRFMLVAAEAYLRKIDEMKPRDVRRVDVIPAAFGTATAADVAA